MLCLFFVLSNLATPALTLGSAMAGGSSGSHDGMVLVRVRAEEEAPADFWLKRHAPLQKLMAAWCRERGRSNTSAWFRADDLELDPQA